MSVDARLSVVGLVNCCQLCYRLLKIEDVNVEEDSYDSTYIVYTTPYILTDHSAF